MGHPRAERSASRNKAASLCCRVLLGLIGIITLGLIACHAATPAIPSPVTTRRADGLTEQEAATLASLKQVDEHPLYTMQYLGATDTQQSLLPPRPETGRGWGCSLFAALGDASNMFYGRTFDWEPSPAVLLFSEPLNGYASVSMVDIAYLGFTGPRANTLVSLPLAERRALLRAPSLPFDGMNSRGLAIGMAAVPDGQMKNDSGKPTIDSLVVIRRILDSAATVDEAVAIFRQYNIAWGGGPPLHYLVADRTGRAMLIEFYQGAMRVISNDTPWHQATNFLQSSVPNPAGQCWRRDTIAQRLAQTMGRSNPREAMRLLRDVSQNNTQWSIVYGMSSGEVNVTMGRHYDRIHSFGLRLTGQ